MRKYIDRQRRNGFTLTETLVALFLFALFGLSAVASLTMALRQWGILSKKVNASQNARFVTGIISAELRQGVPNPSSFGWSGQSLPEPTAILVPNAANPTTNTLTFNEPNPANYDTLAPGWDPSNPDNYRTVTYTVVQGGNESQITREEINYTGGTANSSTEVVARGDFLDLSFEYVGVNAVNIIVRARQGTPPNYNVDLQYASQAYIIGK